MFERFHISDNGRSLCHDGILMVDVDQAIWMNPQNLCPDCRRRFMNIARMMKLETGLVPTINKKLLRELSEK